MNDNETFSVHDCQMRHFYVIQHDRIAEREVERLLYITNVCARIQVREDSCLHSNDTSSLAAQASQKANDPNNVSENERNDGFQI